MTKDIYTNERTSHTGQKLFNFKGSLVEITAIEKGQPGAIGLRGKDYYVLKDKGVVEIEYFHKNVKSTYQETMEFS